MPGISAHVRRNDTMIEPLALSMCVGAMFLHQRSGHQFTPSKKITRFALRSQETLRFESQDFAIAIVILTGAITSEEEGLARITPAGHALVVPPGRRLSVTACNPCDLRVTETDQNAGGEIRILRVSPLLHAVAQYDAVAANVREVRALFLAEMYRSDLPPPGVRLPYDPRARWIAQAMIADPSDSRSLADFAELSGTSRRTLLRMFVAQSGLTFRQFRQHVRIYQSLAMLADGGSIQDVAFAIGYESAPAFIAAFRRIMGQSPGRYRQKQAP